LLHFSTFVIIIMIWILGYSKKRVNHAADVNRTSEEAEMMNAKKLFFHQRFQQHCSDSSIRVWNLKSPQGKRYGSSDGSSVVVAPLFGFHHLRNRDRDGLLNDDVERIVDREAPHWVKHVCQKLGMNPTTTGGTSRTFVPHDTNNVLQNAGFFNWDQYSVGPSGNIINENEVHSFVEKLESATLEGKAAATFWFHGHVVSILPLLPRSPSQGAAVWFDVIDSHPRQATLVGTDLCERSHNVSRIRCFNNKALSDYLMWYAYSNLGHSTTTTTIISCNAPNNNNPNNDDPHLFQTFLWKGTTRKPFWWWRR